MPDRKIREGFKHSQKVNQLDDRVECALTRLILTVDDYGVYYADPMLVRAAIWPTKSYRVSDVVRALDTLERAGLIARWTDKDGVRYLCLLRFRQDLKWPRRRFPKPPFDPDTGEMDLFGGETVDDPPEPIQRKEVKRREGNKISDTPPAPLAQAGVSSGEPLEAWLARLRMAWPSLNVDAELQRAITKKTKAGETLERGWFEKSWLPQCTETVTRADVFRAEKAKASEAFEGQDGEAPEGWHGPVDETPYGRNGALETMEWCRLPKHIKAWARAELEKRSKQSNEDAA